MERARSVTPSVTRPSRAGIGLMWRPLLGAVDLQSISRLRRARTGAAAGPVRGPALSVLPLTRRTAAGYPWTYGWSLTAVPALPRRAAEAQVGPQPQPVVVTVARPGMNAPTVVVTGAAKSVETGVQATSTENVPRAF